MSIDDSEMDESVFVCFHEGNEKECIRLWLRHYNITYYYSIYIDFIIYIFVIIAIYNNFRGFSSLSVWSRQICLFTASVNNFDKKDKQFWVFEDEKEGKV